jgi:hypothetical protein
MIPAYGRLLIELRNAGRHPDLVVIAYCSEFALHQARKFSAQLGAPHPLIATAEQVRARCVDWWLLRGLSAVVLNADGARFDPCTFAQLVADVAREAAPVLVFAEPGAHWGSDASEFLFCLRYTPHAPDGWPAGWSDQLDRGYLARLARRAAA